MARLNQKKDLALAVEKQLIVDSQRDHHPENSMEVTPGTLRGSPTFVDWGAFAAQGKRCLALVGVHPMDQLWPLAVAAAELGGFVGMSVQGEQLFVPKTTTR